MKYLIAVFGVTLAFVFATAIADNPVKPRHFHSQADWNDVGGYVGTLEGAAKPAPIRRNEYR